MKIFYYLILVILVFLAVSSGVSKILLMQQDVDFFSQYGFTNPMLITFGLTQFFGGILLAIPRTRLIGAIAIGFTFIISAAVLGMSGNIPITLITIICVVLLWFVIKNPLSKGHDA